MSTQDSPPGAGSSDDPQAVPHGDEPGASTTQFDDGNGTVGLGDRIGGGAPDTNQGKTEPMPATPGHADPDGTAPHTDPPQVPELADMNVGSTDPQTATPVGLEAGPTAGSGGPRPQAVSEAASRLAEGAAADRQVGTVPADDRPVPSAGSSTGSSAGPETPGQQTTGTAHRAVGQQGETPEGESVESDTQLGADRMVPADAPDRSGPGVPEPGDSQGVSVPHEEPVEGSSQTQEIAHGIKDPAT